MYSTLLLFKVKGNLSPKSFFIVNIYLVFSIHAVGNIVVVNLGLFEPQHNCFAAKHLMLKLLGSILFFPLAAE